MNNSPHVDLLILGAGPAGLAAANACLKYGVNFRLVESGILVGGRDHTKQEDLGRGVGGAGLYSDGKFSFFPSASSLWTISPRTDLENAYTWVTDVLRRQSIPVPDLVSLTSFATDFPRASSATFDFKPYPSFYASLDSRLKLIRELQEEVRDKIIPMARAVALSFTDRECRVKIKTDGAIMPTDLSAQSMILATGRFGPILIQTSNLPTTFRRVEIGIRVQQESANFFLADRRELDPKLMISNNGDGLEWRTFCCCREGEIVAIRDIGFTVLSGRSDVDPTGYCNVGFHVRFTDAKSADKIWKDVAARLRTGPIPVQMSLLDFIDAPEASRSPLDNLFGSDAARALAVGLRKLVAYYGRHAFDDASLHGPTLEGFAYYPDVGSNLKVPGLPVWAAGDVSGMFRGIVAALVSGHFCGLQASRALGAIP